MTPNDPSQIIGTTTINHQIRVKLGLAVHEYCMMDFLSMWYEKHTITPQASDIWYWIGINPTSAEKVISDLIDKEFLFGTASNIIFANKWKDAFQINDEGFDKLWKLNPYGSRVESKLRYKTVIKKISPELLYQKLEEYVKACEATGFQKPKMLNSWLNPKKEHWNDPLPPPKVVPVSNFGNTIEQKKDDEFFNDMPPINS